MMVLSPLPDLAGFYQHPYRIETETSIEVEMEDEGTVFRGRIDVLVLNIRLWILVIEAKRTNFDIQVAIPQTLTYILANPDSQLPSFGLVTNGYTFIFLKLVRQPTPQYGNSRLFLLINPGNELYGSASRGGGLGYSRGITTPQQKLWNVVCAVIPVLTNMVKLPTGANGISAPNASKHSTNGLTPCIIIATSRPNRSGRSYKRKVKAAVCEGLVEQVGLPTTRW
jgi:hypothetical protein